MERTFEPWAAIGFCVVIAALLFLPGTGAGTLLPYLALALSAGMLTMKSYSLRNRERQRAQAIERSRQESQQALQCLIASVPDAFFALDKEWRVIAMNEVGERTLGRRFQDVHGQTFQAAFPNQTGTIFEQAYRWVLHGREAATLEGYVESEMRWFEVHVHPWQEGIAVYLRDVTERKAIEAEQFQFAALVENSDDCVSLATMNGTVFYLNAAGRKMLGIAETDHAFPKTLCDFYTQESSQRLNEVALPAAQRGNPWKGELQVQPAGEMLIIDVQVRLFPVRNPRTGETLCMALVQRDITERKWFDEQISMQICHVQEARVELEAQQQELAAANQRLAQMNIELEALATTDGLTGVRNHRAFQEKLQEEFRRQQRYGGSFSLLLLDVDSFKKFNDSFGHPAGDEVLKQVATLLKMSARQTDYAARYGGEEFALILPETDEHGALVLAERIRAAIEEAAWEKRPVTISVGVSTISREINTPAALIASADEALYTSKARGRNCVTHHRSLLAKAA